MPLFRFLHTSDLHLGRRFGNLPEDARGRLVEARHQIIGRLTNVARERDVTHVLVAGDIFDTETPSDQVWRQALTAMASEASLHWWLIPGNHDSLAAESLWQRFRAHASTNVHLLSSDTPVDLAPGVVLLPAPSPQRYPGRDLTQWMAACETAPEALRIGLAHGPVHDFGEDGAEATDIIPPDRAVTARLDYLALGDWHGKIAVGPRTWYSGTPERDSFNHGEPGVCLVVSLASAGALPEVEVVEIGTFAWSDENLPLIPGQDAAVALAALLLPDRAARRNRLMRIRAQGRVTLAERATLQSAAAAAAPEFCFFELDDSALQTEFETGDLDAIDRNGALRLAADSLRERTQDEAANAESRRVAAAALNRLYGYLKGDEA